MPGGYQPGRAIPHALTGAECAQLWSKALGREVVYDGDLDRWYDLMADRMPPRDREDFRKTYMLFKRMRLAAAPADLARAGSILGHASRSYARYVEERSISGDSAHATQIRS